MLEAHIKSRVLRRRLRSGLAADYLEDNFFVGPKSFLVAHAQELALTGKAPPRQPFFLAACGAEEIEERQPLAVRAGSDQCFVRREGGTVHRTRRADRIR